MEKKIFLLITFIITLLTSCSDKDNPLNQENNDDSVFPKDISSVWLTSIPLPSSANDMVLYIGIKGNEVTAMNYSTIENALSVGKGTLTYDENIRMGDIKFDGFSLLSDNAEDSKPQSSVTNISFVELDVPFKKSWLKSENGLDFEYNVEECDTTLLMMAALVKYEYENKAYQDTTFIMNYNLSSITIPTDNSTSAINQIRSDMEYTRVRSNASDLGLDLLGDYEYLFGKNQDFAISVGDQTVDSYNWMSRIDNERKVCTMCIPGSHDSGTFNMLVHSGMLGCVQLYDYEKQARMGVRYFDLRVDNNGTISHGPVTCRHTLGKAVGDLYNYVDKNPTEGFIVSLQYEEDPVKKGIYKATVYAIAQTKGNANVATKVISFLGDLFGLSIDTGFDKKKYIADEMKEWCEKRVSEYNDELVKSLSDYSNKFVKWNQGMTMADLRGKICLLVFDYSKKSDNIDRFITPRPSNNKIDNIEINCQNEYDLGNTNNIDNVKMVKLRNVSKRAMSDAPQDSNLWSFNSGSGYIDAPLYNPPAFSAYIASALIAHTDSIINKNKTCGEIFTLDYVPLKYTPIYNLDDIIGCVLGADKRVPTKPVITNLVRMNWGEKYKLK